MTLPAPSILLIRVKRVFVSFALFALLVRPLVLDVVARDPVDSLPGEISKAVYHNEGTQFFDFGTRRSHWRLSDLQGPNRPIEGELVRYVYPWTLIATSKTDSSKVLQSSYLRSHVFSFVAGDLYSRAEIAVPTTGEVVVLVRPRSGLAPEGNMLELAVPSTVKGLPKRIIENRLCPPTKVTMLPNGKERWAYFSSATETKETVKTVTTTTNGAVGLDGVNLNTTTRTPVMMERTVVLWNFALIFDDKGVVERLEQGPVGPGEWKTIIPQQ